MGSENASWGEVNLPTPPVGSFSTSKSLSAVPAASTLAYGSFNYTIQTSEHIHSLVKPLWNAFLAQQGLSAQLESTQRSDVVLFSMLFDYVVSRIQQSADKSPLGKSADREILRAMLDSFESDCLNGENIHTAIAAIDDETIAKDSILRSYYSATKMSGTREEARIPILFQHSISSKTTLYGIFGGQGSPENCFGELQSLWRIYQVFIKDFVETNSSHLRNLCRQSAYGQNFSHGLDVVEWLNNPDSQPALDYLVAAPVSFPLIGLVQLCNYAIVCHIMRSSPGQVAQYLKGATGHSQGIVAAVVVGAAETWEDFYKASKTALTLLFHIGSGAQSISQIPNFPKDIIDDCKSHNEGAPSPMLSVRDWSLQALENEVDKFNRQQKDEFHVEISLKNGVSNFVVSGDPHATYAFNRKLRNIRAPADLQQGRIPFSQRKPSFISRFLPMTAPFHNQRMALAMKKLEKDTRVLSFPSLRISIFNPNDGSDMRFIPTEKIIPTLIKLISVDHVDWPKAITFPGATHIIDFGPGRLTGACSFTNPVKQGTGVRIILPLVPQAAVREDEFGSASEMFSTSPEYLKFAPNWAHSFTPRLRSVGKQTLMETKMSRLLKLPPVMVAGMTPTTVDPEFVVTIMNAGYHVELAGGGYHDADAFASAIRSIASKLSPPRGITLNLIYANPKALRWQISMISDLRKEGIWIDGLTLGAGVPSLDVANQYIHDLGLRHISFKPGNTDAVVKVIEIAKANPNFPIILQATGGRGGGHHSSENFDDLLLRTYHAIRKQENIVLVAGSGFGGAEDTYPYLFGSWSEKYSYPRMPFDGVLFGSRVMVTLESPLSVEGKQLIMDTPGLDDEKWEKTYDGGHSGGVLSVMSEMGEPIHKLATRGVLLWNELDKTIFSLPKPKRLPELQKKREYIIRRLNNDFQKVWFGKSGATAVDLDAMTYAEVLLRLLELLYIGKSKRWIHSSWSTLTANFIRRIEERFASEDVVSSVLMNDPELVNPFETANAVFKRYPDCREMPLAGQDVQYFLKLCKTPGQKPVPFVPVLDEDFETWFKKDSLWQCEDLEAVVGHDIGRTCILQGPVAAKFATSIDQPIQEFLDGVVEGWTATLSKVKEPRATEDKEEVVFVPNREPLVHIQKVGDKHIFRISSDSSEAVDESKWFALLAGAAGSWRHAIFNSKMIVRGSNPESNPFRNIFRPAADLRVEIDAPNYPLSTRLSVWIESGKGDSKEEERNEWKKQAEVWAVNEGKIALRLIEEDRACSLSLEFAYLPESPAGQIHEITQERNHLIREFYRRLWLLDEAKAHQLTPISYGYKSDEIHATTEAISKFSKAIAASQRSAQASAKVESKEAPLHFAVVLSWKATMATLCSDNIDADLTKLVHLSNEVRLLGNARPLIAGNAVVTTASVTAIVNEKGGKMVEITSIVLKDNQAIVEVKNRFLFRGTYSDIENTFQADDHAPRRISKAAPETLAVLYSKEWFHPKSSWHSLVGEDIEFEIMSLKAFSPQKQCMVTEVTGSAIAKYPDERSDSIIADIQYEWRSETSDNPVLDYLDRVGRKFEDHTNLSNPIPLSPESALEIQIPSDNAEYSDASGDWNPIHTSAAFSRYADLDGTITHGMHTAGMLSNLIISANSSTNFSSLRYLNCSMVGMVFPNDTIEVEVSHVAMVEGRKVLEFVAKRRQNNQTVMVGRGEIEQPSTCFLFTGQGSQRKGMGMELYESSAAARKVWDRADRYYRNHFGFSILQIVRENPKSLTIYFGGSMGRRIRANYISLSYDIYSSTGEPTRIRVYPGISEATPSFTFVSATGLLSATQFTQPAIFIMENAIFEDLKERKIPPSDSAFAGHSLGEYCAIGALTGLQDQMLPIVFNRGTTMQSLIPRDREGRSDFGMCAVDPSRVHTEFGESHLREIIEAISAETGWLLQLVNLNVKGKQYVCTGQLRALLCLSELLDVYKRQLGDMLVFSIINIQGHIQSCAQRAKSYPNPVQLKRGVATIPIPGLDVPFHSRYLRDSVPCFRTVLQSHITRTNMDPTSLIGKYIPNLTGKPFKISKDYFQEVFRLTGSGYIHDCLENWPHIGKVNEVGVLSA